MIRTKHLLVILITMCLFYVSTFVEAQNIEIYKTNDLGIKNITPSIIIDENSVTGNFDVYMVDHLGLRRLSPDAIITSDKYRGTWKVYRVSNYGLKEFLPTLEAETSPLDSSVRIYDVDELGLKDISPTAIIEKDLISGEIKLFNVNCYGIKDIMPSEIIKKEGDCFNVYGITFNGMPEMTPKRVIEVKERSEVFGIALLPSIRQVKLEPGHQKLKNIERIKAGTDSLLEKEGWRRSKPKAKVDKE